MAKKQKVELPETDWIAPDSFPDLSKEKIIAIDLETRDPSLMTRGPGWARNEGEVIGIAVAVDGWSGYYPIAHEGGGNLDRKQVIRWFKTQMENNPSAKKLFHNAMYDVGWLRTLDIYITDNIIDTMVAAPLINEDRWSYALNALGKDYLGERKNEKMLEQAAQAMGFNPKSEMWRLPANYVGEYAEQDAALTLKLWHALKVHLEKEDLWSIFELESSLTPMLVEMRARGVRVDLDRAEEYSKKLKAREIQIISKIKKDYGVEPQLWANASLAEIFDNANLPYPRTEKTGAPSFQAAWLESHEHELPQLIVEARKINKARTTFIEKMILEHHTDGRIHAELHPLRSDDGGTVSGRFSYSNPNLQQVPARDPEIGKMIRSLFIPEEGCYWGAFDYSAQEPRLTAHYAHRLKLPGAAEVVEAYNKDPNTDFHQMVADMANIKRKEAKAINLGLAYGMGQKKLANELGLSNEEAQALFTEYHQQVPFMKGLSSFCSRKAAQAGAIRTLLGRRCRFSKWEPSQFGSRKFYNSAEEAKLECVGAIRRAFTYKAMNRLIQGSAADMTKKAMLLCYQEGYLPHLQIHDELDFSLADMKEQLRIQHIMEHCVEISVPLVVDVETGPSWGEAK